jgi:hypothetical protein
MKLTNTIGILCAAASAAAYAERPSNIPQQQTSITQSAAVFPDEFRSFDGSGNNPIDPFRGAANIPLLRHTTDAYGDGKGSPAGANELGAREISDLVFAQDHSIPCAVNVSDFLWDWGQFVDHDIDMTPTNPDVPFNIPVPAGDPWFDPDDTGTQVIDLERSIFEVTHGVRQQMNVITAFIDGSQVYGSDPSRAMELRTLDGTGMLKSSAGNLLPYNVDGFPNQPDDTAAYFLAGDVRVNEQVALTAVQTLFMREHNYWAGVIKRQQPDLDDDGIYYRARAIVGAEIQIITYRDFLPLLLGPNALRPYTGYNPDVNPGIENVFSTAIFRVGHTMLSPDLQRLDAQNQSIGSLPLADAFFNPTEISGPGIEPYLRGLAKQIPQEVDCYLVDGVRNFLFGPPGAGGFDLASLNIQRGRDHGLPRYNVVRQNFGLPPKTSFAAITSSTDLQAKLASAYATPDDIDVWVGALAEDHRPNAIVGELVYTVLRNQFTRLRDGDRFWYSIYLPPSLAHRLEGESLASIIRRNSTVGSELQNDVFIVPNE